MCVDTSEMIQVVSGATAERPDNRICRGVQHACRGITHVRGQDGHSWANREDTEKTRTDREDTEKLGPTVCDEGYEAIEW